MTIRTTQLAMGYVFARFGAPAAARSCSNCSRRFVLTAPQGTFPAGSLKCTRGGFITDPAASCAEFNHGPAMSIDPAVRRAHLVQIGPVDV